MNEAHQRDFEAFVRQESTALLRTAYLLVGDRGHAEDLLQTVLLKMARRWNRIDGAPRSYARRALVNGAVDGWRRRRLAETPLGPAHESWQSDPTATLDLRDQLVRALTVLSPQQRAVLVLRYFEDLPEAEIARTLGCSPGAVKSYAFRGLTRLREITDPEGRACSAGRDAGSA